MTWLEEAKKRCEEYRESMSREVREDFGWVICNTDLPAAIARIEWQEKLLERARLVAQHSNFVCGCTSGDPQEEVCMYCKEGRVLLRDLEGGPPDGRD